MSDQIPTYAQINRARDAPRKKAWAQANKDKINAANKRWREKHREALSKKQQEYYKRGYYLKKLQQKFEVMRGEILTGNDSEELLEEFGELIEEMHQHNLIDNEEFDNLIDILP